MSILHTHKTKKKKKKNQLHFKARNGAGFNLFRLTWIIRKLVSLLFFYESKPMHCKQSEQNLKPFILVSWLCFVSFVRFSSPFCSCCFSIFAHHIKGACFMNLNFNFLITDKPSSPNTMCVNCIFLGLAFGNVETNGWV